MQAATKEHLLKIGTATMNIFFLDRDPWIAAQMQCDKHVVKMTLETLQILNTVAHKNGVPGFYKPTHPNHPSVIWAGESVENFSWLIAHFHALCSEYRLRYGKTHACEIKLADYDFTWDVVSELPEDVLTPPKLAVLDYLKEGYDETWDDAIRRYRAYYATKPEWIMNYTNREIPSWLTGVPSTKKES